MVYGTGWCTELGALFVSCVNKNVKVPLKENKLYTN